MPQFLLPFRGPLSSRSFVSLAAGRLVSSIGNAIAPIALVFAVLDTGGSAGDIGVVLGARTIAVVASLLVGGVIADRYPVRALMVGASAATAVSQLTVAALVLLGAAHIWLLAALQVVNGVVAALLFPAMNSALPRTLALEHLRPANVLVRLGTNTALIGGAALGGVLVSVIGAGWSLALGAVLLVLAAVFFTGVRLEPVERSVPRQTMLRELVQGWQDVRSRSWVWACVAQWSVVNAALAAGFDVLGPVTADRHLGGAHVWGLLTACQGLGLVVGGVLGAWQRSSRPLLVGVAAVLLVAPLLVLLAQTAPLPLLFAASFLSGVGLEVFAVNWHVSLQQHIPPDRLARVYAYDALGSNAVVPLGNAMAGPASAALGLAGALWSCGLAIVAATAGALSARDVRTLPARTSS